MKKFNNYCLAMSLNNKGQKKFVNKYFIFMLFGVLFNVIHVNADVLNITDFAKNDKMIEKYFPTNNFVDRAQFKV